MTLSAVEIKRLRDALEQLGIEDGVRLVDGHEDELVVIIPPKLFPLLNERELTKTLTVEIGRKVWFTTDAPGWHERSRPLKKAE